MSGGYKKTGMNSPNEGRERCERFGKDILTRSEAKGLAKRMARHKGANIQAYACRACGSWHVGAKRRFA